MEIAINESVINGPTLLLGIAYEQAGKLIKKWTQSDLLSGTFIFGALRTYKELGASAKCVQMESEYSILTNAQLSIPTTIAMSSPTGIVRPVYSGSESSGSGSSTASDSVDLATLLSAVSTWQRENSASRVAASLVSILMKSMGARYGALALMSKDGILRLSVAGTLDELRSNLHVVVEQCGDIAPASLINYAMRTRKTIVDLVSISAHVELKDDPFFAANRPKSVFVLPIVEERSLRGVCYMDSAREHAFSKASLELVGLLTTGAAVAIERVYLLNELDAQTKSLEHTVRVRTAAAEAAAAKAEQASQAQARFLQTMSHEMRTPLNSVVVLSDLLLEARLDPVLYEYVSTIKASSNDLLAVIRDVLDFSRLESKNIVLEQLPLDIVELVDGTLDQISQDAVAKNIELSFAMNLGQYPPMINGDSTRIKQCLINFLSNALKFTGENGSVTVTMATERLIPLDNSRLRVRVDVADTGIGIPASKISLLFKKFSQLDNSTTRLFGGSGLGLAIVRELAHLMDGDTWCESDFGKGSIFHFTFEAGISTTSDGHRPITIAARDFQGKVAAVVGLRTETGKALATNLTWLGFEVLSGEASTDFDALVATQTAPIDLIILSLDATFRSPEELVQALTAGHSNVRFIFISAKQRTIAQMQNAPKYTRPVEFLSTPLKIRSLNNALTRLFRPTIPPVCNRIDSVKKRPKAIPRLAETCPMTILCVDDNAVNIKVLQQIMRRLGYDSFDVCYDGQEAVDKCRKLSYDLVLMDLQMPKLDGTSAMSIVREEQPPPQGPAIVALTASAMSGDKDEALRNGFYDYISKPRILTSFIECLERVYNERMGVPAALPLDGL